MTNDAGKGSSIVNSDAMFFDPEGHAESLALLASAYLSKGSPASAFPFADRRCRIFKPGARDYLLRAESSRMAGFSDYARADLAAAVELDPIDPFINLGALSWGAPEARVAAARRIVADDHASRHALAMARDLLFAEGARAVQRVSRSGRSLVGWVVWNSPGPIEARPIGPRRETWFTLEPDPSHPLAGAAVSAAGFAFIDDGAAVRGLEWAIDGEVVERVPTPPAPAAPTRAARRAPVARASSDSSIRASSIDVIVPVYEDFAATRACLTSLISQESSVPLRLVAVDDASPNAEIRDYLDLLAERGDVRLIRNPVNLGFAAAVNRALALREGGDVLLVNADAWLPPGAIDRLAAVAYSEPEIGTVTPLSNNGEVTSYPAPHVVNPMPEPDEIRAIDAAAQRANGDGAADLPNGVGFCLFIKSNCLDSVGPLSEVYLRGYYEDVEFCLKAREHGFRNVCATGVYVGHAGSLSFADKKRALVVRNLAVLELRLPGYRMHSAAFVSADPLREARARIDELRPPEGEAILLASAQGKSRRMAGLRAKEIASADPAAIILHCVADSAGRRVEMWREGRGAPKSLRFAVDSAEGLERFRAYLDHVATRRVELFDAPDVPEAVLRALFALGGRVEVICGDLRWFGEAPAPRAGPCQRPEEPGVCSRCGDVFLPKASESPTSGRTRARLNLALGGATSIRPLDRVGDAFARRVFKAWAVALEAAPEDEAAPRVASEEGPRPGAALGILAPCPSPAIDRLVSQLGRRLASSGSPANIVVIGRCVDDLALMATGNIFVTGEAEPEEYERLTAQYGVGPLWLADRTAFFGLLDRLASATGAPKAYFDWSFGGMETRSGDLAIDPRICDEKAADAIAFWLGSIYRYQGDDPV